MASGDFFTPAASARLGPPFPARPTAVPTAPTAATGRSITIPIPTIPVPSFQAAFNAVVVVVLLWHSGVHLALPHVGPLPIPAPVPAPAIVGAIDVTYLVDGEHATPSQGALRRSTTLRAALSALDATFHSYQSSDAEAAPFAASVQSAGLPCAVVTGPKGEALATLKAPDEPALVAAVKARRGK